MTPPLRPYTGEPDLQSMAALATASPTHNLPVADLPYRFSSWALDDPANIALWVEATGTLLGWAILQTPSWAIDAVVHPQAAATLYPQILAWADALTTPARIDYRQSQNPNLLSYRIRT